MNLAAKILCAVLVLVGITVYQFLDWITTELKPRYREAVEESLVDTAYLLSTVLGSGFLDAPTLGRSLENLKKTRLEASIYELQKKDVDLRVSVTDARGVVIFDSYEPQNAGKDFSAWRNILLTLRGEYGARSSRDDPNNPLSTVLYVSAPVTAADGTITAVVTVGKPTRSADYFINSARKRLVRSAALMSLALVGLAAILSAYISRPISRLTEYARALGDGEPAEVPAIGRGEVGRLAQAFERMRISLEGKKYVEEYIQTLTHEIKSPLAAINGAAELMLEPNMPAEKRAHFLENIRGESRRIQQIVERLLELAALETRRGLDSTKRVDLGAVCFELADSFQARFEQRRINYEVDAPKIDAGPAVVYGDPFLIRQSVSNLLDNAIDFSPPGGTIVLSVRRTPAGIEVAVSDTGSGIPDYALSRVRERFFSLPRPDYAGGPEKSSNRKSSGLGLTLVDEVMKLHGGDLVLENRAPVGTTAILRFPPQSENEPERNAA